MAVNKVVYGGNTIVDLTGDTITPEKLLAGATAHSRSGEQISGLAVGVVNGGDVNVSDDGTLAINANAVSADYTATIGTGWSGSAAPYSISVTVSGILASDNPFIDLLHSSDYTTALKQIEAWNCVYRAETTANTITFYATDKPSIAIPIKIKAVRK